jgi:secreted PhoX family phosphatase
MLCADVHSREIRRFLTGPHGCEITGNTAPADGRSMFVSIQHPGEPETGGYFNDPQYPKRFSAWPDGPNGSRPRSAVVVITKEDDGVIGT